MMRQSLFLLALLASALTLPLTAHADPIDNFVLTGDGHTITYSLPATSAFPDFSLINFFDESGPATIDGVSGYSVGGLYYFTGDIPVRLILTVPDAVFGVSTLYLGGPNFFSFTTEPASNPPPYLPFDIVTTFIPGTYDLQGESFPILQPLEPPVDYTLTITQETAATPEPSTLALLATGALGVIAFAARRKTAHRLFN
jgi:PEP-CTERM motif